jgi:hypothetical protein
MQGLCLERFFHFHPPYILDLAARDFHLVTHLKQFLDSTRMVSDGEVKKMAKD